MIDILCGWEPPWPGARSVRERLRARPRAGREKGWAAPGGAAEGAGPPSEKGRRRGRRRRVEATSGPRRLHEGIALAAADAHGSPLVTVGKAFNGESGGNANGCSEAVATAFNNMRQIVTVGWSIYPLGYFFGYLLNSVDETFLNVIYNIADFVNKIAFVLSCWSCAKADSEKESLLG